MSNIENLTNYIQTGFELVRSQDYQAAIAHLQDREVAQSLGLGLVIASPVDIPADWRRDADGLLVTCDRLSGFYQRQFFGFEQTVGDYYHVINPTVTVFDISNSEDTLGFLTTEGLDHHNALNYVKAWTEAFHYQSQIRGRSSLVGLIPGGVFVRDFLREAGVPLEPVWETNHRYYLLGYRD